MDAVIRPLTPDDADAYQAIRLEMLKLHPEAFASAYEDEAGRTPDEVAEAFADAHNVVLGAFVDGRLVGTAGLFHPGWSRMEHKRHIGGMYVQASQRGTGLASRLVRAALATAASQPGVVQVDLCVVTTNTAARRLYERCGFSIWGTEPRALLVDGVFHDEHHMVARVDHGA